MLDKIITLFTLFCTKDTKEREILRSRSSEKEKEKERRQFFNPQNRMSAKTVPLTEQ